MTREPERQGASADARALPAPGKPAANLEPSLLELFLTRLVSSTLGKPVYRSFADRLPLRGDERVLDFGCGTGTVARFVAPKLPCGRLVCLDISRRRLRACEKTLRRFGNVAFMSSPDDSLEQNSFDLVYCHFVLHELPKEELKRVLPALAEALTRPGTLVLREPMGDTEILTLIRQLLEGSGLSLSSSRVLDVPLMGNTLESVYRRQ